MARENSVPAHLSDAMRRFYRRVDRTYRLSEHHKKLLVCACEAHDRMVQARDLVSNEGLTTVDRHGQTRPHPGIAIERDSRTAFARMLRELALTDDTTTDNRPPRLRGYAGRP